MHLFSFGKDKKQDELLSGYLDGELEMNDNTEVEERIVMDPGSADRLARLEHTALLCDSAMIPQSLADAGAFADRLLDRLGRASAPDGPRTQLPQPRRIGSAAVLASVGLIVTAAGVTLVGLRRRGVV